MRSNLSYSIRTRLLWLLFVAILLTAVTQGLIAYRSTRVEADQIFDYHMQQMAMSLRSGLPSSGLGASGHHIAEEDSFDFVVQVWTADGLLVFVSATGAALPQHAIIGFSDVKAHGTTYRVFSLQSHDYVIQVAQDMAARRKMASTLVLRIVLPIAVMAPLLMLLVWWGVSFSLTPVALVRQQLARRQPDDLDQVSESGLPDEIRPLVRELNLLFGRVHQAFEAQKNFVADAAHELRSPLAALKLQAQGIRRATDDAVREVALTRLTAGIDRAARLVEQLLVLARQQASIATGAKPQPIVLAEIARLVVADAAAGAHSRGVDLGLGVAEEDAVMGHADALRILMRNLLDNAVKYTPSGGTVDLEIHRLGDQLMLSVEDSGPGIPQEDRARALSRFYRVSGTQTSGSGLGLAIVKSIADLHGATVVLIASKRLGGLRVEVVFPVSH